LCISVGYFTIKGDIRNFRVTSFGEEKNPSDFNNLLNNHFNQPQHVLCGHNKEFDIPFLARRMIINNIAIPDKLNLFEKPWKFRI
jgi:DNA polymerase III epsilon subunit-like protein